MDTPEGSVTKGAIHDERLFSIGRPLESRSMHLMSVVPMSIAKVHESREYLPILGMIIS